MQISNEGIAFIKDWEKFRAHAYQDSAGKWTIGYGLRRYNGRTVVSTDTITEPQADALLRHHIKTQIEPNLNSLLDAVTITQNQYDALCSLCYNIGVTNFKGSTLYARIMRRGTPAEKINNAFLMWRKEHRGGHLVDSNGLINRRNAEIKLFHSDENSDSDNH